MYRELEMNEAKTKFLSVEGSPAKIGFRGLKMNSDSGISVQFRQSGQF